MKVLVTGSKGFVGKNLILTLERVEGIEIYPYDIDTDPSLLDIYTKDCEFVFNLAGVNRPENAEEFMEGNFGFAGQLLECLKKHGNRAPVMLSSSIQATLIGRYGESDYGKSKLAGEELFFRYAAETGSRVLIYRFPNLFGKWCRPNYNSAVATFCYNMANDLPLQVNDRATELELLYIDDLVAEMRAALEGKEHRCDYDGLSPVEKADGPYCFVPTTHQVTLGKIVDLLETFRNQPQTLIMPDIPDGSFAKKLYSTYLSYLPESKVAFPLKMNIDQRGSFTELLKTANCGQFSVNVSNPGIAKGQHWHHSKWEFFIVVSGHGLIRQRMIGTEEMLSFEVDGSNIQAVHMLPGYTHNIINLSETEPLITVMWANEPFDPKHPDTFSEPVEVE
ncbi:NAD-dependent epimerase/dehydratase family protein [Bacillota bacterium]